MPTKAPLRIYLLAIAVWLSSIAAAPAQTYPPVPDHTVIGRIGTGTSSGPSQAIPFATLGTALYGTQSANTVYAGPPSGSAVGPTFRALVGADLPVPTASTLGGIESLTCSAHQWVNQVSTLGVPVCVQPGFADLSSGTISAAQLAPSPASHGVVIDVAGTPTWTIIPNCIDSGGQHINYTQSSDSFSCGSTTSAASGVGTVDNLLPNVQMQQWTNNFPNVRQNAAGTGPSSPAVCPSFTTTNGQPTFTCTSTGDIKIGDIIAIASGPSFTTDALAFWGFPGPGLITCSQVQCQPTTGTTTSCTAQPTTCYVMFSRVINIVANTSITVQAYFNGVSPATSSATWLYPITRGDNGSLGVSADGWTKASTLIAFPDDFSANAYPGAIRTLAMRKGVTGNEFMQSAAGVSQVARFRGQTVTCGVVVNQKVQGGSGTWQAYIQDSAGTTYSSVGAGVSFGGYQFLPVTRTSVASITSWNFGVLTEGNAADVYDMALPTCFFGTSMVQAQLHQNSNERIRANGHCNPPILTPMIIEFNTGISAGAIGFTDIDLEAISGGCWHNSIGGVWTGIELSAPSANIEVLTGTSVGNLTFGPKLYSTPSSGFSAATALLPLSNTGTTILGGSMGGTFIIFSGTSGWTPNSITFDFWDGEASSPSSIN